MHKTQLIAVICATITLTSAQPVHQFNGNLFVDGIITALNFAYGEKLNSLDLPSRNIIWSENVGLINITGTASLSQGHLTGFKSIHRTGNATIRYLDGGKRTSIVCKLGAEKLGISYTGKVAFMVRDSDLCYYYSD